MIVMKRNSILYSSVTVLCILLFSTTIVYGGLLAQPLGGKYHDVSSKVKKMAPPSGDSRPTGAPIGISIVYPTEGSVLTAGTHEILVSASAKSGVSKVDVKIEGPENQVWTSMEPGEYYSYSWTVETDGQYVITARITDSRGKQKTTSVQVTVGEPQPEKWAVVIGIADYRGIDSDLWNPDEDAKEMQQVLLDNGFPEDNIKMVLNKRATADAIVDAINWLVANEGPDDTVVFFYSGHGFNASDSDGWDIDTEVDGSDEGIVSHDLYGIPDGYLQSWFSNIESSNFALLFGSCHSGGMFDDDDDLQGDGRIIAAACKADQYGWDYLNLGNTLWGYYFVDEGLLDGNALSIESAHEYAYPKVVAMQSNSEPQLYDNDLDVDFIL